MEAGEGIIKIGSKKIKYIEITEENKDSYTIEDVIFPIIGHQVKLPKNKEMALVIEDILKEDGITMATFASHEKMVTTSASGSYRKIVARATDIESDIVEHQNNNEDLLNPNYLLGESDPKPSVDKGDGNDAEN